MSWLRTMAKKLKRTKAAQVQGDQSGANRMGTNAQRIGTALAGVLLAEIVEVAVERLLQKRRTTKNDSDDAQSNSNVLQQASAGVQDTVGEVKPAVSDVVDVVRSILTEFSPGLMDTADSLKNTAGQAINQTVSTEKDIAKKVSNDVVDKAQRVVNTVRQSGVAVLDQKDKKKKKK